MFDKSNRGVLIFLIILVMIVIIAFISKHNWDSGIKRPDSDPVALISQTEYNDSKEYTRYVYYIYKDNGIYIYFKTKSVNNSDEEEIEFGKLKQKKDMNKIKEEIENDKKNSIGRQIIYEYKNKQCRSFDELVRYLW